MRTSMLFLLLLLCCLPVSGADVLSTVNYINFQPSGSTFYSNFAGVSLNLSQIYSSAMNTSLFQGLLANSKGYASYASMWPLSIKTQWPKGYKYNCSAYTAIGITNFTCLFNYSSINNKMTPFTKAAGPFPSGLVSVGFDMEKANFSNSNFATYFSSYCNSIQTVVGSGFYPQPIEAFDGADLFATNGILPNYTAANFVNDMNAIIGSGAGYVIHGPGITQAADPSWLATYNNFKGNSLVGFTVKAVVFNASTPTISDLLNESNYRNFLLQRFTYNGQVLNPAGGNLIITELKMTNGVGINGVTNSFASALWAIDIAIEFAMFGGKGVKFPCDISTGNFQSILGPAPTYLPTPLYYGLLFLSSLNYVSPKIGVPLVTAGTSSSIKAYGFILTGQLQIVLINKDTNPNASGPVQITVNSSDIMKCLYLSAPNLSSTTNVTWMGYTFNSGSSAPQGNYTFYQYYPTDSNTYMIPLNYSQAVMCYLGNPATSFTTASKTEPYLSAFVLAGLLIIMLLS